MYKWLAVGHKTRTLPALHTDWQYLGLWPMPNMAGMQLARPGPTRLGTKRNGVALFDARSVAHMPAITFTNLYILCLLWHCQWQDRRSQQLYWLAPARLPHHATPLPTWPPSCLPPLCASVPPRPPIHIRNDARSPKMHADHIIIAAPSLALRPRPTHSNTHWIWNLCSRIMQATMPNHSRRPQNQGRIMPIIFGTYLWAPYILFKYNTI